MKKKQKSMSAFTVGCITAVVSFVLLSIFAGGLVSFSPEVGVFRYLQEVVVYAFTNKFAYKFAACLFLGLGGSFVSGMISYGKQAKMRTRARATRVQFQSQPESKKSGMSKTA